jgi:hypothetical protein
MKNIYYCPQCDQHSTRRWNLETHIKRRHGGTGRPIPEIAKVPLQSAGKPVSNNWLGDFRKSRSANNIFSATNNHPLDLQKDIIQTLRVIKEIYELRSFFAPGLNFALPMNIDFSNWDTILGFKGYVCEKCLSYEIKFIFDDTKRISLKSNHTCNQQRLYEAQHVKDTPGTIHQRRRQEMIFYLTYFVNDMTKQQELVNLTAVEVTASVFDIQLNNYEEYIDLDSLEFVTLDWAYRAAKEGKTMINKIDLQELLDIFEGTLGFFRLKIDGVKRYFFVYIANGLESWDIKRLKILLPAESATTTEIVTTMNYWASNKAWREMFIEGPLTRTCFPPLRPDKFNFLLQNASTIQASNISTDEWDEIRERQEYAFNKTNEKRRKALQLCGQLS